ncbi:MAG: hypothetical protein HYV16_05485 [Gammaproteobacteria bacterium]|nr:hypothetical protein [Gammaproteobacteria bacterium]
MSNLARHHRREDIEAVAQSALAAGVHTYSSLKHALERRAAHAPAAPALTQTAAEIRDIREYQDFFDTHTGGDRRPYPETAA